MRIQDNKIHQHLDRLKSFRLNQETVRQLETIVQYRNNKNYNWTESYAILEAIDLYYKKVLEEYEKEGK